MNQNFQNEADYVCICLLIAKEFAPTANLILKQIFFKIHTKNHYRRMLCSAIASLNHDAKNFFLSFYSLDNYYDPYANLIRNWNRVNCFCESVRPYIKRSEYEATHNFLTLESDNIMLWQRRIQMRATINEWKVLPDKEQAYGKVADAYNLAVSKLAQ